MKQVSAILVRDALNSMLNDPLVLASTSLHTLAGATGVPTDVLWSFAIALSDIRTLPEPPERNAG